MEFEELQQIWDSQSNQPLYVINEKALHNRILSKKKQVYHITKFSELLVIIVNIVAGSVILAMNLVKHEGSIFLYMLSAWMLVSALYTLVIRARRIRRNDKFDRSVRGDLDHAIAVASYQVRFSQIMRWNTLPIGILLLLGIWESGKPVWLTVSIFIFFAIAYYAAGWECNIYKRKKRELEILQDKLQAESLKHDQA